MRFSRLPKTGVFKQCFPFVFFSPDCLKHHHGEALGCFTFAKSERRQDEVASEMAAVGCRAGRKKALEERHERAAEHRASQPARGHLAATSHASWHGYFGAGPAQTLHPSKSVDFSKMFATFSHYPPNFGNSDEF